MPDQVIGTARIDIVGNAEGIEAATAKAKASVASMSKDAQAQYSRLSAAEKRRIDSLIRQADTAGMTRAQQIAYNASLKTSGPLLDDLTRRLKATETATKKAGIEFNKYGISAKQELAAIRQTPAQLTDIIVSLQGGQRPLTVLLQQGGQLRDIFGGIVPAVKALGSTLIGLINPATLSAGALAALSAAWLQGSTEMDDLRKQVIMTGNALGASVDGVSGMAASLDDLSGVTRSKAVSALTEIAASGKIAGDRLQLVAEAALRSNQVLGREVSEVVEEFASLGDKPTEAVAKLNRQYHFLTAATYEQIAALVDQGREQDAIRLATDELANVTLRRLDEVESQLNVLGQGWASIKNIAAEAWDEMLGIGRKLTIADQIKQIDQQLNELAKGGNPYTGQSVAAGLAAQVGLSLDDYTQGLRDQREFLAGLQQTESNIARARALDAKDQQASIDAQDQINKLLADGATKAEKMAAALAEFHDQQEAIRRVNPGSDLLLPENVAAAEAAIRARFKERGRSGPKRSILYSDLDDLIASPRVQKNLADYQRQLDSVANLIDDRLTTAQQRYTRELEAMGQGDWARRVNAELQRIADRYDRIIEQRRTSSKGLSAQDEADLRAAMDRELQMAADYYAKLKALQGNWLLGASDGLASYADEAANVYQGMQSLVTQSFGGMTDALTDFVTTGKASFSDLANSIIHDMVRISVQQSITGPLAGALGTTIAGLFAPTAPAGVTPGVDWTFTGSAKGNVFDTPSLSRYSNTIVDRPTFFAKGGNVMGEAGPEAIMPLKRGPDGRLGVHAPGPSGVGDVTVNINNESGQPMTASQPKVSFDQMGRMVIDVMISDLKRNGPYARQLKGAL